MEKQNNKNKKNNSQLKKGIIAGVLTAGLVGGTIFQAVDMMKDNHSKKHDRDDIKKSSSTQNNLANGIIKTTFNGTEYYSCTPEFALNLAQQSLIRVHNVLTTKTSGTTPVGDQLDANENINNLKDFYPQYYNAYLLAAVAKTESTFRISQTNGDPLVSKDGAIGMMQIKPSTVDEVNRWLKTTMEINDLQFSVEDLNNPEKSLDIANYYLISLCKNHAKEGCKNPIYTHLDEDFSFDRQEEIILALYNNGYDNMMNYVNAGTVYDYLNEGSSENYVNKVLKNKLILELNHSTDINLEK